MSPDTPSKTFASGVAILVLVHLAIAVPMAYSLNIWMDEASSLYATQSGFFHALQTAAAEQKQAPLYFWILSVWRLADDSVFFARLFSILCSVGAIAIFAGLARRLLTVSGALAATAFFALHPFLLWASLEIRVYSLVVLLSVILTRLFLRGFFDDEERPTGSAGWWFLAVAIISLYTNYYLAFLLTGLGAALIITGKLRAGVRYTVLMLGALVAFLPMAAVAISELGVRSHGADGDLAFVESVRTVWQNFQTFLLPTEILPGSELTVLSSARLWIARALAVGVFISIIWFRRQLSPLTVALGGATLTIAALLGIAGLFVGPLLITTRHASVMFALLIIGVALLIRDIAASWNAFSSRTTFAAMFALSGVFFSYSVANLYPRGVKNGDWAKVARFIEQNESAGQPIVVFQTYESLAPRVYYRGANEMLPNRRFFEFVPGGRSRPKADINEEIAFVTSEIPKGAERIWFVMTDFCLQDDRCSPLKDYLAQNYTVDMEKEFYLTRVSLLRKK